jgi:tRNA dimethylallyltransferase
MRGRVALFVGGTMLYERALARGLAALPAANPGLRSRLDARARASGWPALHAELARVDPATAARLEPTDAQRIQRALEVFEATGTPLSILHARAGSAPAPLRGMRIALEPSDRTVLHERIAWRFREMLANGLLAEVEELRRRHALHAGLPSMRAVGYRQAWEVLEGTSPASALAERGIAATRQLAKRQLTWLRSRTDVERLDCLRADLADAVSSKVARFLEGNAQSSP